MELSIGRSFEAGSRCSALALLSVCVYCTGSTACTAQDDDEANEDNFSRPVGLAPARLYKILK